MDIFLQNILKDIDGHRVNIDNFNKELLSNLDKGNKELLQSLGINNDEMMDNLQKMMDGVQQPVHEFVQNIIPKPYNPFKD